MCLLNQLHAQVTYVVLSLHMCYQDRVDGSDNIQPCLLCTYEVNSCHQGITMLVFLGASPSSTYYCTPFPGFSL